MSITKNIREAQTLTDDLVVIALQADEQKKAAMLAAGRGRETIGESIFVFHLKVLRKKLEEIRGKYESNSLENDFSSKVASCECNPEEQDVS